MNEWSVKVQALHDEIYIFDFSKMLKIMNIHFNLTYEHEN